MRALLHTGIRARADHDDADTLFYVDPPYVTATRTSSEIYRHEMADADHKELLERLAGLEGYIVLSGYDSPLYRNHLRGWKARTAQARVSNSRAARTEGIWLSPRTVKALRL